MKLIDFLKKTLRDYFIIVTGINLAMAILGMNMDAERSFSYEAFYSPLIIGVVALLPSFVMYSYKEISLKKMVIRRGLHLLMLELILIGFGYVSGFFEDRTIILPFILTVFLVYIFTLVFRLILDRRTAQEINKGLKRLQED
ncbi:MAG: hypothetical protein K0R34_195 [Herbinix sp.]|jgi:hypothetical protein|nr:hypothetical protein [Herbinix sp.]